MKSSLSPVVSSFTFPGQLQKSEQNVTVEPELTSDFDNTTTIENEPFEDSEEDGNKTNIFVTASGETIQCGIYKDPLSFIFGGEDADPGEFPFVALIGNKRRRVTIKSYLLKLWLIFKF